MSGDADGRENEALEPFQVLFEDEGLPRGELPEELARVYGGGLGLPERCLYANFVATVDGVVALPGVPGSNELVAGGSEADRFLMGLLRAHADAVLIGAGVLRDSPRGTWLPEKVYPPAAAAFAELRRALGLAPEPEVAVLSGRGEIDPRHPRLAAGALVLTGEAGARRLEGRLPPACALLVLGEGPRLDGRAVVDALRGRGHRRVLSEAGPRAFGTLLAAGVVDELFLTTSPALAGDAGPGSRLRLVEGADLVPLLDLRPLSLRRHGDHLFARYAVGRR
ncbi:MAG TPA: dihydrofolate reductase family protein [Gaiellaceae bacterium]|nr:dihydrofolate reductase family protein [Gaiellaceae bacterium]